MLLALAGTKSVLFHCSEKKHDYLTIFKPDFTSAQYLYHFSSEDKLMILSNFRAVNGTYGRSETPCTVFVITQDRGYNWYCVQGSLNVNCTAEMIEDFVNVEQISDLDYFTASEPINNESEFFKQIMF